MPLRPDNSARAVAPAMPEAGAMPVTQYMPQRGLVDSGPSASNALSRPQAANQAVRRGVITGFIKVCERWQIGTAKQIALLGYADDEFAGGQILSGRARGAQDVKDRVGYMVAIAVGLRALFNNNTSSERRWLEMPRPEIGNKSPLDYMAEGRMVGMMQVRELVDRERAL